MRIEAGKRYVNLRGETIGPMEPCNAGSSSPLYPFRYLGLTYMANGAFLYAELTDEDLIAEYVESGKSPTPRPDTYGLDSYGIAATDALVEVRRTKAMWPNPANSAHEQYAVLLEEVDELKAHVWTNQKRRDLPAMRKEAIQVAAMALRFAAECCDETTGRR